jgi:predicted CXXCH cytochrome family protein
MRPAYGSGSTRKILRNLLPVIEAHTSQMMRWHVVVLSLAIAAVSPSRATAQTLPTGYAGSEACKACHEDIYNAFTKSPHHAVDVDTKRGWKGRACESCHGPAQAHTEGPSADNIRVPAKLTAVAADQICLNCHLNQPTQAGRLESSHARNQIACTACHKVHASEPLVIRKAEAVNKLCGSCHLNVWAQFQRPFHHKPRRRHDLRGLPQSSRQHPARDAPEFRGQRPGMFRVPWRQARTIHVRTRSGSL